MTPAALIEGALWGFSIETPEIPSEFNADYEALTEEVCRAVESLVLASRAFFRNIDGVADRSEDVADRLAIYAIKRTV